MNAGQAKPMNAPRAAAAIASPLILPSRFDVITYRRNTLGSEATTKSWLLYRVCSIKVDPIDADERRGAGQPQATMTATGRRTGFSAISGNRSPPHQRYSRIDAEAIGVPGVMSGKW